MTALDAWFTAKEAVNHLSPTYGGPEAAKAVLMDRLRDGAIAAQAAEVIAYDPAQGIPASLLTRRGFDRRTTEASQRSPVSYDFWRKSTDWAADSEQWDWRKGDFRVSQRAMGQHPTTTVFHARGVEFRRIDIEALAGVSPAQPVVQEPRGVATRADEAAPKAVGRKRGPKRKSEWDAWIAELMVEIHEHGIRANMSPDELIAKVDARLPTAHQLNRTAYNAAAAVLERWRKYQHNSNNSGR